MKTVTVHRAANVGQSIVVEPVSIVIDQSAEEALPKEHTLPEWEMLIVAEGNAVADALVDHLPQGVLHRITVRLLERWVGSFNGTFMGRLRDEPERAEVERLRADRDEAREWVKKLQRETQTLTCVYCGKEYPPGTPTHGSAVLTEHIKVCTAHPMRKVEAELEACKKTLAVLKK